MTDQSAPTTRNGKSILIFADGTGNEGGLLPDESRSNVYKLYRATRVDPESEIDPEKQIAFYIRGIGTIIPGKSSFVRELNDNLAQAFGNGLTDRIIQCYMAIISAWRPGDRIYLFGFSRGAYTVRCLAHVLERMGIPTQTPNGSSISFDPKKLRPIAKSAVRILYRYGVTTPDNAKRDKEMAAWCRKHKTQLSAVPYFIGVWDTVAAMGWERLFPGRYEKRLPPVMFVRHAMAIDEYRRDFPRAEWGSAHTMRQPIAGEPAPFKQVWFAGNHADIGGSYPENESRLSDITLDWIAEFIRDRLPEPFRISVSRRFLNLHPSCEGMLHDECMSGKIRWKKTVRHVDAEGELHQSVLDRLALPAVRNFDSYGPYRPANLEKHPGAVHYFHSA